MNISILLIVYGCFLILSGITAVLFIGLKAKTALASGGLSGVIAILIGYVHPHSYPAVFAGMVWSFLLFGVFAWRSTKTLYTLFEWIPLSHPDLKGKAIAFLIISLMALVSVMVTVMQLVNYFSS